MRATNRAWRDQWEQATEPQGREGDLFAKLTVRRGLRIRILRVGIVVLAIVAMIATIYSTLWLANNANLDSIASWAPE